MRKPIFILWALLCLAITTTMPAAEDDAKLPNAANVEGEENDNQPCLLYTSPSPRDS